MSIRQPTDAVMMIKDEIRIPTVIYILPPAFSLILG